MWKKGKENGGGWGAVQAKSCSVCPKPIAEQWLALLILMGLLRLQVKHVLKSHTGSEIRIWYLHSHCPYTAAFRITEQIFKTTLEPAGDFFHPVLASQQNLHSFTCWADGTERNSLSCKSPNTFSIYSIRDNMSHSLWSTHISPLHSCYAFPAPFSQPWFVWLVFF